MIKFFRKIRYDLMEKNPPAGRAGKTGMPALPSSPNSSSGRAGGYLLYAIGEIVLVVIGILLALQINNWNETRKDNNEEIAILKNLNENLFLAQQQSESFVSVEKALKQTLINVLNIEPKNSSVKKASITDSIFRKALWSIDSDLPVMNTYIELKNTNKLSLIKNQGIREKFTSLEVSLNELERMLNDRLSVHQIRIDNVAQNDMNFIPLIKVDIPEVNVTNEIPNDYNLLLNDQKIRNLLGIKLTMTQNAIDYRENVDRELKELIVLIEKELNGRK